MDWLKILSFVFVFFSNGNAIGLDLISRFNDLNFDDLDFDQVNNTECGFNFNEYVNTLKNFNFSGEHQWALRMLDSSAKIPDGLLSANLVDMGNFDECLAIEHPSKRFKGKHCMISVGFRQSNDPDAPPDAVSSLVSQLPLKYALCIPSTCLAKDINFVLNATKFTNYFDASAKDANCWTNEPRELSNGSWAYIYVCIVILALAACSTAFESYQVFILKNAKPNRILSSFSIYKNTKDLLEIRPSGEMDCLHGIRTLSMMWVMLCHTYMGYMNSPAINLNIVPGVITDVNYSIIINGFFSVDSFFFLSGVLVAFVFFRNISRNGYFDVPSSYIHRYLRLTPAYVMMVMFNTTLLGQLSKGPLWDDATAVEVESCREHWWSGLIYLQNYINPGSECLGQSWYLSADMQMFWISPIILYPLYFWPAYGIGFLVLLTLASNLWTLGLAIENDIAAGLILSVDERQFNLDYVPTHTRIMPWLVGLGLGFAICAIKGRKVQVRLNKAVVVLGWLSSAALCIGILYSLSSFTGDSDTTELESAIYVSFTRTGWGIGLAWVVFACVYGYGGVVNWLLSLPIFQPLGKLSYNTYLIHQDIITYRLATLHTNVSIGDFNVVFEFFGVLFLSYILSLVLYLFVEAPVAVLDRELLNPIKILPYPKPKKRKTNKLEEVEMGKNNVAFDINSEETNTTTDSAKSS